MSDNVSQWIGDTPSAPNGILKKIGMMAAVVVLVLAVLALIVFRDSLNLDSLRRLVKYMNVSDSGTYGSFTFDSHSNNRYASFQGGLAVASVGGLNTYNENGEEQHVLQQQISLPQLQVQGNLAMAYDVGGKSLLVLHSRSGEVLNLQMSRPILDADLSSGGQLCLSSSATGYKSVLSVYSDQQKLIYRWLSSTAYLPLCAISPNGKQVAAVALGQENGAFQSSLYVFSVDSEDIQQVISLDNQLIYDLYFVNEQTICALGESSVRYVRTDGEIVGEYSYSNQYLKNFDNGGSGFLTLSLNMYKAGNRYSIVTVDEKGQELAQLYLGQEILDLSACGKYIAVLTPQGLTIYNRSLEVYAQTAETGSATAVVMREDGSALLLGGGQGRLYLP